MQLTTSRRRVPVALLALVGAAAGAATAPAEVHALWPQARLVGQARLRVLGFHVYDARLWSPQRPMPEDWTLQPFALELVYARALSGAAIAERSVDEMRRQGEPTGPQAGRWLALLKATFPDVAAGDRLTGVHRPGTPARFHHNGAGVGEWSDAELVRRFFGIWLAPQTSEPALREALFGGRG